MRTTHAHLSHRLMITGVALAVLVLFLGCGIESTPFIAAPKDDETDTTLDPASITFLHNENDNDTLEFSGYELYYKIYEDESPGCDSGDECFEDRRYILDSPVRTGPSRLRGRSYRRMIDEASPGQRPNIPVSDSEKGNEFEVELDMYASTGSEQRTIIARWPDGPRNLERDVPRDGDPSKNKAFLETDAYTDDDEDLGAVSTSVQEVINNENLYAAVYALGFGVEPGSLQDLYSEPVFLGYVQLRPR
ncbi:MAG: hypothetical protein ACQETQ_00265 [Spirochaetota bacterium]